MNTQKKVGMSIKKIIDTTQDTKKVSTGSCFVNTNTYGNESKLHMINAGQGILDREGGQGGKFQVHEQTSKSSCLNLQHY